MLHIEKFGRFAIPTGARISALALGFQAIACGDGQGIESANTTSALHAASGSDIGLLSEKSRGGSRAPGLDVVGGN